MINQIPTRGNFPLMSNKRLTLGKIIRSYKARATKYIHDAGYTEFCWQSRFYDQIIRNNKELENIREYIVNNPMQWYNDEENPALKRDQ